jgi:Tfp pilus assembly protein PilZ
LALQDGRFTVTGRLFKTINDISPDKQFILYKQLVKDRIVPELFQLIIDLSEDQKLQLFEKLSGISFADEPLKTINLDDSESFIRENLRKNCLIAVTCKIGDRSFESYIIDISQVGVFIESNDVFPVGQKITVIFKLPNYHHVFQLNGRITRSEPKGISVKFHEITPTQEEVILKFIEAEQ